MSKLDLLAPLLTALEDDPTSVPIRLQVGQLLLDCDNPSAALDHFVNVLGLQPANAAALRGAGLAARALGDTPRADTYLKLEEALSGTTERPPAPPPANGDAQPHAAQADKPARRHASLAAAQLGAGRPAEALRSADDAVRLAPEWEWAHRLRAEAFLAMGRPREALTAAQVAVRLEPKHPDALQVLASAQISLRRLRDADKTTAELVRIAPGWAESFNTRGRLLVLRRKFDQAESDFRTAVRLAPDEPAYMNNLGLVLNRRGRRKESIDAFTNAARTDPNFATARSNLFLATGRYLWGGGFLLVISLALHAASIAAHGDTSDVEILLVLIGVVVLIAPLLVMRYWLRRREVNPTARNFYEGEIRRALRRPSARTMVKAGGLVILLALFVAAVLIKQTLLAAVAFLLAIIWLHRGTSIWGYASRFFSR